MFSNIFGGQKKGAPSFANAALSNLWSFGLETIKAVGDLGTATFTTARSAFDTKFHFDTDHFIASAIHTGKALYYGAATLIDLAIITADIAAAVVEIAVEKATPIVTDFAHHALDNLHTTCDSKMLGLTFDDAELVGN